MARFIDAVKTAEIISDKLGIALSELVDVMATVPTADVQEVVRCKNCKHLLKDLSRREAHLCIRTPLANSVTLDSYCSFGERMDGEK